MKKTDRFEKKQRVKLMLLAGRKLTVKYLDSVLGVNNSPEIIRKLRAEMTIVTEWVTPREGGRFGRYFYVPPKKESRISNQTYRG